MEPTEKFEATPSAAPADVKVAGTEAAGEGEAAEPASQSLRVLVLSALGVVFGDIGTSPLYALRECFHGPHAVAPSLHNILGVLSLIFWSLIVIISVKYLVVVMRADNRGEGGILALMALALEPQRSAAKHKRALLIALGVFGAALLYGDGIITPAISVLSAVEGLQVATPVFAPYVIPITLVVLLALFVIQKKGSATVGTLFGPITLLWFITLAALGVYGIAKHPAVLAALNPLEGYLFFQENGWRGFLVLGSVVLVITGGEALYADMGHFGMKPIRIGWFWVVLPALLLNYFGQGALLITQPHAAANPFYLLAPSWLLYPLVGLATLAAVIASQALISGAFSITRQAIQLGFSPRFKITHTSVHEIGQIYVPGINWILLLGTWALVLDFGSSSRLAATYGVAVTATMVITAILAFVVARERWGWGLPISIAVFGLFLLIDLAFFSANFLKISDGGWLPLAVAGGIYISMTTWKRGRQILAERMKEQTFPLDLFLDNIASHPPVRVPGVAVFMTGNPEGTPPALMHNLKHNKVLHQRVVLLTLITAETPHIPATQRVEVHSLNHGLSRVVARYGFMETPDVPELLKSLKRHGLDFRLMDTTYFLGRETLIPTKNPGMALWREGLFSWMSRNAHSATDYFNLPANRVVELGTRIEL